MKAAIGETNRRRALQEAYNREHGITPESVRKNIGELLSSVYEHDYAPIPEVAESPEERYRSLEELEREIKALEKQMREAAKALEFEKAAVAARPHQEPAGERVRAEVVRGQRGRGVPAGRPFLLPHLQGAQELLPALVALEALDPALERLALHLEAPLPSSASRGPEVSDRAAARGGRRRRRSWRRSRNHHGDGHDLARGLGAELAQKRGWPRPRGDGPGTSPCAAGPRRGSGGSATRTRRSWGGCRPPAATLEAEVAYRRQLLAAHREEDPAAEDARPSRISIR